jgi:hypothetical protein
MDVAAIEADIQELPVVIITADAVKGAVWFTTNAGNQCLF